MGDNNCNNTAIDMVRESNELLGKYHKLLILGMGRDIDMADGVLNFDDLYKLQLLMWGRTDVSMVKVMVFDQIYGRRWRKV